VSDFLEVGASGEGLRVFYISVKVVMIITMTYTMTEKMAIPEPIFFNILNFVDNPISRITKPITNIVNIIKVNPINNTPYCF
jgi:hypothetical protein